MWPSCRSCLASELGVAPPDQLLEPLQPPADGDGDGDLQRSRCLCKVAPLRLGWWTCQAFLGSRSSDAHSEIPLLGVLAVRPHPM
jgi:hypothetical protein